MKKREVVIITFLLLNVLLLVPIIWLITDSTYETKAKVALIIMFSIVPAFNILLFVIRKYITFVIKKHNKKPLSLKLLKVEKPEYLSEMVVIHQTKELPLPYFYIKGTSTDQLKRIEEVFLKMPKSKEGSKLLKIFGLIEWRKSS